MRILGAALSVGLAALSLAACTNTSPPPEPTTTPAAVSDASGLVGLWQVSDVEGIPADTTLKLETQGGQIGDSCGFEDISWAAQDGLVVAGFAGFSTCLTGDPMARTAWLESVVRYKKVADTWVLLSNSGDTVATLSALSDEETVHRNWLLDAAPLPPGLVPADLHGRWIPEGYHGEGQPFVEFLDGSWNASDGCNSTTGRWVSGDAGLLLTSRMHIGGVGCDGLAVEGWVEFARTAGFDGDTLVFLDADGVELGRLVRG